MNPNDTSDRADATVWLPLLNILGGVAERVVRHQQKNLPTDLEQPPRAGDKREGAR